MLTRYGLPLLALIALGFAGYTVMRLKPVEAKVEPPVAPPSSSYEKQVGAVGLVEASSENVAISLPVPGLVTSVSVKAGDTVRKGQILFTLDARDLQAERALRQTTLDLAVARLQRLESSPRPEEIPPAEARVREAEAQLSDVKVQLDLMEGVRDKRAIRTEDLERRRRAVQAAEARVTEAKASLALLKAGTWAPDLQVAKAEVAQAKQSVQRIDADISRMAVASPMSGKILQAKVKAGEYAAAGPLTTPLMLIGSVEQLNVRAEIDERDAIRVDGNSPAKASIRGAAGQKYALRFVRFEPFVVPKKNLTNDASERVDTRVLQAIYELDRGAPVFVGQQMDVFIEARQ
jgi:HlyD family secretion protein